MDREAQVEKAQQIVKEWEELAKMSKTMYCRMKGANAAIRSLHILDGLSTTPETQKEIAQLLIALCTSSFENAFNNGEHTKDVWINRFRDGVEWTVEDLGIFEVEEVWNIEAKAFAIRQKYEGKHPELHAIIQEFIKDETLWQ